MADVQLSLCRPWRLRIVAIVVCLVVGGGIAGAVFLLAQVHQRLVEQSAVDRATGHFNGLLAEIGTYLIDGDQYAPDLSGLLRVPSDESHTWEHTFFRATPAEVERLKALAAKEPNAITAEEVAFITDILDVTYHAAGLPYKVPKLNAPTSEEILVISRRLPSGDYRLGFSSGRVVVEPSGTASKIVQASNEARKKSGLPEISLK
jgi:hypothetical protein